MNIKIGKSDIASLACDGCKKRFVCNLANKKDEDGQTSLAREHIEKKLEIELPEQDPPAIFKNAGGEGEKQVLLHLLQNRNCSIFSMREETSVGKTDLSAVREAFKDKHLGLPYLCFSSQNVSALCNVDSETVGKCRYKTETEAALRNIATVAEHTLQKPKDSMYFYQLSFKPDISLLPEQLHMDGEAASVYKSNDIEVTDQRPDLLRVLPRQAQYPVLGSGFVQVESDGSKYILEVCDIKTSEFSSSFFFELAFYMVLLKLWIDSNGLHEKFEVSYKAEIIPFDVVSNSVRAETWQMDFSLVREKIMTVFNKTMPDCIAAVETGDKSIIETVKYSPGCQVCDYYGGQFEGDLYKKLRRQGEGSEKYKEYIQDPVHNFCRYCLATAQDINILPGLQASDVTFLQSKGIHNLSALKSGLAEHTFTDNAELMSNSEGLLREIAVHGMGKAERKVDATNSLGPYLPNLRIFTLIRQDSQRRTLCYGISYKIFVNNILPDTVLPDWNVVDGRLDEYRASEFLVEIDSPKQADKLKGLIAYLRAMHGLLTRYADVCWQDSYGNRHPVTYGIFYWGKRTFDAFKINLQELLEYLVRHEDDLAELYPELTQEERDAIIGEVKETIQAYADLFTDDRVTDYKKILKSPLYDLQAIYKEVAAVDTNFSYNLMDVHNVVCGKDEKNPYYRPDSDQYSTYVYDGWFAIDGKTDSVKKEQERKKFESRDKQHLHYLSALLGKLYNREENNPFSEIVKKGEFPVVGMRADNERITDSRMLLVYLYQRLNAAYDQVEIEDAHVAPVMKKQYGGTCIRIEQELTSTVDRERVTELLKRSLRPNEKAYRISRTAENANLDENSFGLTVYPADKFADTFKKISNNKNGSGCLYVDVRLGQYDNYKPYTQLISCGISYVDNANRILVLKYKDAAKYKDRDGIERVATDSVLEIMDSLRRIHGFDFAKDLYVGRVHIDIWSRRLKETILKLETERRSALDILLRPVLKHEKNLTEEDVRQSLQSLTKHDAGIKLDGSQLHAITVMYNDNITLLWGPPGTGKSHTLAHYLLLELQKRKQCKVLLMGNYNATNNLLNSLLKSVQGYDNCDSICRNLDIVRFYSETKIMENLMPVRKDYFSTQGQVYDFIIRRGFDINFDSERPFVIITSTPEQMARLAENNIEKSLTSIDKFDIVIVDEASQMDVGHFLPALLRIFVKDDSHTKLIIAGDDKQLQPVRKEEIKGADEALFGSVYNYFKKYKNADGVPIFKPTPLEISRRSNHCIIDFIREAFAYDRSFNSSDDKANALVSYQNELYADSTLFAETLKPETGLALLVYDDGLSTQRNEFEINQICSYVQKIWECGLADVGDGLIKFFASGVGIVVPHTAQRTAVRKRLFDTFREILPAEKYSDQTIRDATFGAVDTVERFQGQERDIILAGYVVGNKDTITNEEEFIYDRCRMNVIISRAKYKAIVMASRELMDNISNDIEIIELQKAFQKLKDYCNSKTFMIQEGEWLKRRGQAYVRYV